MHGAEIKLLYAHDCSRCGIYLVGSIITEPTALVSIEIYGGKGTKRNKRLYSNCDVSEKGTVQMRGTLSVQQRVNVTNPLTRT